MNVGQIGWMGALTGTLVMHWALNPCTTASSHALGGGCFNAFFGGAREMFQCMTQQLRI